MSSHLPSAPLPSVQLLHTLRDGSSHIDWMFAANDSEDSKLITFRLSRPVHELAAGESMDGERIGLHRRAYLEYEGPVPGDRGTVKRIARGEVREVVRVARRFEFDVRWLEPDHAHDQRLRIDLINDQSSTEDAARIVRMTCLLVR